ncbi:MAG TPA: MFS transporter [Bacillota bacterium]|nr:MFS transporter [Bacillota bacterium]
MLSVDFVLFLAARHWSAAAIGLMVSGTTLAAAALNLWGGTVTDRHGRRRYLVGYQVATAILCGAVILLHANWVLILAALLLGFGLGPNAALGPFAPAEQAWLAQYVDKEQRGRIFSVASAGAFLGMAVGSLAAAVVPTLGYNLLFTVTIVMAAVNFVQYAGLEERAPEPVVDTGGGGVRQAENRNLLLLSIANGVAGLGMGLFAQILPYWLSVRYGVGAGSIGPVYAIGFLLAAGSSVLTGEMSSRFGLVRAIVWARLLSILALVALPFMPTFAGAAVMYTLRSVLNRGSVGARQAFSVNLVRDGRRGLAGSLNNLSQRLPGAVGPAVAGWMIGAGLLSLPLLLASGLQLVYVGLFAAFFRNHDRPAQPAPAASAATAGQ